MLMSLQLMERHFSWAVLRQIAWIINIKETQALPENVDEEIGCWVDCCHIVIQQKRRVRFCCHILTDLPIVTTV
jgi:hypothetical protein